MGEVGAVGPRGHREVGRQDVQGRVRLREAPVLLGDGDRAVALGTHAQNVEIDAAAQMSGQEVDVDPGSAVDVGRVLAGEEGHAHGTDHSLHRPSSSAGAARRQ